MPLKPIKPKELEEPTPKVPEKKEPETVFIVQEKLPEQPIRQAELEDGRIATILTTDEAMTEILNIVKKLEKGLL